MGQLEQTTISRVREDRLRSGPCRRETKLAVAVAPGRRCVPTRPGSTRGEQWDRRPLQPAPRISSAIVAAVRSIEHQFEPASRIGHGIQSSYRFCRRTLLPSRECGGEQLRPASKVPVEAALRHAEPVRQCADGERTQRLSLRSVAARPRPSPTRQRRFSPSRLAGPGAFHWMDSLHTAGY